jgi:hypothetical protein
VALIGRLAELAECQHALSLGGNGTAGAMITGSPGMGKTSLWRAVAAAQPAGVVVLRTTGVPASPPGFANLADLFDSVADTVLPRLPAPQADALRGALGRAAAQRPLGTAVLERARGRGPGPAGQDRHGDSRR